MTNIVQLTIGGRKILHRVAKDIHFPTGTLVLLHGYGADENDLMGLAPYFDENLHIISLRGPGSTIYGGASWFDIDMQADGSLRFNAEQALASTALVIETIRELHSKKNINKTPVVLGGFSQGASIASLVTLTNPDLIQALLSLSGRLIDGASELLVDPQALLNMPVFVGHGINDTVIPVEYGRQIVAFWQKLPVMLSHHEYPMGHEISQNELSHIQNWMDTIYG